eukprot:10324433-Alexandrium_andersonii.AAC.1
MMIGFNTFRLLFVGWSAPGFAIAAVVVASTLSQRGEPCRGGCRPIIRTPYTVHRTTPIQTGPIHIAGPEAGGS